MFRRQRAGGNNAAPGPGWLRLGEAIQPFRYSWIPEALRDSLLRVIEARLAPDGIAMVSFNVLPGWRLFQIARDSMILHARLTGDPARRAQATREVFAALAAQSPQKRTCGRFWREEAQRMAAGGDAYLAHEIFEESNAPLHSIAGPSHGCPGERQGFHDTGD